VYVGVGRGKLGSVVATVAERDERKDETTLGVSGKSVAFRSEYSPIIGASFLLMPKLTVAMSIFRTCTKG
jgi:hypothetical protein